MPVYISMLRGVNLGKHKRVGMDALRAVYESLKLTDVQTYVQSGNVLFRSSEKDESRLAKRIEKAIAENCGFESAVIIRTPAEMRGVVERNPFAGRTGIEPAKLAVIFLRTQPPAKVREKLLGLDIAPEELRVEGRELYIYFTNGMARPKLSTAVVDRILKIPGTARNWNSVTKLQELGERLEASK